MCKNTASLQFAADLTGSSGIIDAPAVMSVQRIHDQYVKEYSQDDKNNNTRLIYAHTSWSTILCRV